MAEVPISIDTLIISQSDGMQANVVTHPSEVRNVQSPIRRHGLRLGRSSLSHVSGMLINSTDIV